MALKKVIYFDKAGAQYRPETDDDQAKPNVYGVRWVNADSFETIRVRGGARTDPHGKVLQEVDPTLDLSAFAMRELDKHSTLKK